MQPDQKSTKARALLARDSDVKNRTFGDWFKAHTHFFEPLHRYKGKIILEGEMLAFSGIDVKSKQEFHLQLSLKNVADVHYGFDKVFRRSEERGLGVLGMFQPLRIRYREDSKEFTIYLIINFNRVSRGSKNREWYALLRDRLNASP